MKSTFSWLWRLPLFFLLFPEICAQQALTRSDYEKAAGFVWNNINNKKAFHLWVNPNWHPDSAGFWYLDQDQRGKTFWEVSFEKLKKEPLFDHERLTRLLNDTLSDTLKSGDLPLTGLQYLKKGLLQFDLKGKKYTLDLQSWQLTQKEPEKPKPENEATSPDGKWVAFTRDYNLYLRSVQSGEVRQLSKSGHKNYEYGSYYGWGDIMEGEGGERPARFGVSWSADSRWIQTYICDLRSARKMYLLDWSVDTLYRPRLLSYYRGSPGDTAMVYMIPVCFEVESGREIHPALPRNTHINSVDFQWSETPGQLYADYAERGFQAVHLLKLDLEKNELTPLVSESSATNIDNFEYWPAEKAGKIVFSSERSGWKQLYLIDLATRQLAPLTKGEYFVNDIEHVDETGGWVYFSASGREKGRNPYYQLLYRVSLKGGEPQLLTPEDAAHRVSFSPCGRYFTDNYSTGQMPTVSVIRSAQTGKILLELSRADISGLEALNWRAPEVFTATARDGETIIYGALWKPTHFDPTRKYPIIDNSYTGPHTHVFPDNFPRVLSLNNQALAELGFIVMMVDGLGSSGRSKAFHDHSYKKMGLNLTDHVLAIRELGRRHAWIDTSRVGIFGHSAGGYDAGHGLLQFPDFYKVGVASSADHDHRMEKAWWPEMYMGWPVDSAYHLQSNITMAGNLKGKLLIVHGGIDENVNPSATFKLAEALVKADKQFDMLILPSQRHGYQGAHGNYFRKRLWNYFVEHLLGAAPVWEFGWE